MTPSFAWKQESIIFTKRLFLKLAFWAPKAPHARPSGLYREAYYILDKYFLYTNLHRVILNILHRAISNILHSAFLTMLHRAIYSVS